ncbi:MAG: acyl carrier protein [Desulfobulbaceae bacterium]|jgi:acyl carrier protein|nr:acyl carrier protein [Desulfobulbaceae bacterium]
MTEQELQAIIFAELKKVAPESDPTGVDPTENIREALDIDSYSFQRLLVGFSDQTGIDIPEEDYAKVSTVAGITAYLAARLL